MLAGLLTAPLTRRDFLGLARRGAIILGGLGLASLGIAGAAKKRSPDSPAQPATNLFPQSPRIGLGVPAVHYDGNSVPLAVEINSPMTEDNYVSDVRVVAPGNPLPEVARFHFTPHGGRASVNTRMRLDAGVQTVIAIATFSNGSTSTASTTVEVTLSGCSV